MSFAEALDQELAGTPWLYGPTGRAFVSVVAADQDTAIQQLKDVGTARDPLLAPVDYLPALSHDRLMLRAPPETDRVFAQRLATPIDHWEIGGTGAGYVQVFEPYGFDATTLQALSNHEVGGYWDGNADWFSRVFLFLDSSDSSAYWSDDGLWDAGSDVWLEDTEDSALTWDSSATVGDLRYLRAAIRLQKADHAYPVTIAVWTHGTASLPDGYWDSPGVYDDGSLWSEGDGLEQPVYWPLGNVWGQETWMGDGTDTWSDEPAEELVDIAESETWIAFPGE